MAPLHASGCSEQGPVRTSNQDCFALDDDRGLLVVADGMGGHNGGEVAARLAVERVTDFVRRAGRDDAWPFGFDSSLSRAANLLRTAVHLANGHILEAAGRRRDLAGMGTTIVAALVEQDRLAVAHAGDSRLYVFAGGTLRLLTVDDSWALNRNVLTNVLGSRPRVEVHVREETLTPGELVILVTDGVHTAIDDGRMTAILVEAGDPSRLARALVEAALTRGSRDNCTAVVGCYAAGSPPDRPPRVRRSG